MSCIRVTFTVLLVASIATVATAQPKAKPYVNKQHGFVLELPNENWEADSPNFMMTDAVGCVALRDYGTKGALGPGVILHIHKCSNPWAQFRNQRKIAENGVANLNGTEFYWFKSVPPPKGGPVRVQVLQYFLPCDDTTYLFDVRADPATLKSKQEEVEQILNSFSFDPPSIEPAKPLAHLRFNNDAKDISNGDSKVTVENAQFRDGCLYMDGTHLQPGTSSGKGTSFYLHTPSLEYRQFTLAIRFKAESFEGRHSAIISGGPRTRWLHFSQARSGKLQLGLDNHKQRYELTEIQAGKWYDLVCSFNRNAGRVEIYLNGKALEPIGIPKGRGFAVESMDEKDDDRTWAFQNLANATSFKGLIDELAIYDRALAPNDAAQLKLGEL